MYNTKSKKWSCFIAGGVLSIVLQTSLLQYGENAFWDAGDRSKAEQQRRIQFYNTSVLCTLKGQHCQNSLLLVNGKNLWVKIHQRWTSPQANPLIAAIPLEWIEITTKCLMFKSQYDQLKIYRKVGCLHVIFFSIAYVLRIFVICFMYFIILFLHLAAGQYSPLLKTVEYEVVMK